MWWEYVIVFGCLVVAVAYILWLILRTFSSKGSSCGSAACRCDQAAPNPTQQDSTQDRGIKVTPLVQIHTPEK